MFRKIRPLVNMSRLCTSRPSSLLHLTSIWGRFSRDICYLLSHERKTISSLVKQNILFNITKKKRVLLIEKHYILARKIIVSEKHRLIIIILNSLISILFTKCLWQKSFLFALFSKTKKKTFNYLLKYVSFQQQK